MADAVGMAEPPGPGAEPGAEPATEPATEPGEKPEMEPEMEPPEPGAAPGPELEPGPGAEVEPERPELSFEEEEVPHEEELLRNPFSVRCWLRYAQARGTGPRHRLNMLYERALRQLPGSYKLWYRYLRLRRLQVKGRCPTDPAFEEANAVHERALVFMHKMPRIWLDYCQFLVSQGRVTRTRRTFDRALRALPVTQHHRLWPPFLSFVRSHPLPETALRVFRRYLKLCPEGAEQYVGYLVSVGRLDEAAQRLARLVNDERFVSREGKSNYQLWQELCDLLSQHPERIRSLDAGSIIRGGLTRFTDQLGRLWGALADCYIRSGHFEKVFDSYAQFEESVIAARMDTATHAARDDDGEVELELRLVRFERLMSPDPPVSPSPPMSPMSPDVSPLSPGEVELELRLIISTYTEAVRTVDPQKATGRPHGLWVAFARFYEDNGQLEDATRVRFRRVEDLAAVWCEFGEMELRHHNYQEALSILRITGTFWQTWKEFEIRHGNEDTIRELLRIKRSVQATYNTQVNFMASQMLRAHASGAGGDGAPALDRMQQLELRAGQLASEEQRDRQPEQQPRPRDALRFVRAEGGGALAALSQQGNPDEIDLGDEDEAEPDGAGTGNS
ncbi:hypothetical protein Q9233_017573, partial [Columba guinea]